MQQRLVKTGGRLIKRPLLLAAAGRESSDAATVWKHGAADRRAALADRIGRGGGERNRAQGGRGRGLRNRLEMRQFLVSRTRKGQGRAPPCPPGALGVGRDGEDEKNA